MKNINGYDFYSCPSYLPVFDIFNKFERCETYNDFTKSLDVYKNTINWGLGFDVEKVRNKRPIKIIKIPSSLLENSRIVKQSAGLLVPDQVLSSFWNSEYYVPNARAPEGLVGKDDMVLIEDLSERGGSNEE